MRYAFSNNTANEREKGYKIYNNKYFWQNYKQEEVDYIEESGGQLVAYECKFKDRKSKSIKIFSDIYANTISHVVTRDNYHNFLK